MNKTGLVLTVVLVLTVSGFVYSIQYADAADAMVIREECTSEGWSVIINDQEGNPLPNVRILTVESIRSSGYEESFYTDDKGMALIPFSSITGFVKMMKGGYVDQTIPISCEPSSFVPGGFSPVGPETSLEFLTYTDALYGFKIKYPSTWQREQPASSFQRAWLISPQEGPSDGYLESVFVIVEKTEFESSADVASVVLDSIKSTMFSFQILENTEILIDGWPAQKVVFSGRSQEGFTIKNIIIFTIVDDLAYTIMYDGESKNFSKYLPIFEQMMDSFDIESDTTPPETISTPPIMPQIVSGKYTNSEVGLEIEFPKTLTGFEITIPKDVDLSELPVELQDLAKLYSGMTMVTMLPAEFDPTKNVEMMTITIMETSSIDNFSEFVSQTVEGAASQSSGDTQDVEYQPECDISNQVILKINEMKSLQINSECYDPTQKMEIIMSTYMFLTPQYVITPMYIITQVGDKESDLSIFEDSIGTMKIENTIDISDPSNYVGLLGLEIIKEEIMIDSQTYEIQIVSDSTITNFSFDESQREMSFELQEDKDATLGSTEIYLGNLLNAPYTVTIDGNDDDTFMVTEDKTTGQTSISISYIHPIDKITVSGFYEDTNIPDWIRNNASWWVQGDIDDKAFVGGIQFLIKEGIIQIPETTQSTTGTSQNIPSWIKNNADWWSKGLISDDDFLKGIQFMVENGIIVV